MTTLQEKTVADVVTENIKAAHIFKKHGIDFCCGGGVSIKRACEKAKIDPAILMAELLSLDTVQDRAKDYNSWKLDFLTDHIINVHHTYVEENSPMLLQYAQRVNHVHGHHYTELGQIEALVKQVVQELASHMKKEELILFPFIKKLVKAERDGEEIPAIHFGTVENPIKMMEAEHEEAGEILRQIAKLSNNFTPPQGACNTYRAFYAKLDEFEQDLHQHVHLENNILFPKALNLEKKLKKD
ncbi:MAG TPA: iron-sulfur cluster repair di-iron protein [Aequorivita sp.]|jgi:regulator of cell morphogenesis and NO signaling|nr:iron-sulfur cluster repair di-iron protein [Aequorivita sp.]MBP42318.1 iron-sulfur cluster repair di-iron protein [Aequorivita sp.]HBC04877.1 iron-sulfur cluster repair di-iron protein [Aequorivita sp.]HNP68711.1 iron-sulfur cluster repair di-iron protein [Aequorivita sp.]|tara:strand:- start:211848 stop:212573 length:726 start_codon:yes stop_codon:yes gene_type:complete